MPYGAWAGDKTKSARTSVVETREIRCPQKGGSTRSPREGGPHRLVLATPPSSPAFPSAPARTLRKHQEVTVVIMLNEWMCHGS